jgi:hypothetical protein
MYRTGIDIRSPQCAGDQPEAAARHPGGCGGSGRSVLQELAHLKFNALKCIDLTGPPAVCRRSA